VPGISFVKNSLTIVTGINYITGQEVSNTERAILSAMLVMPSLLSGTAKGLMHSGVIFQKIAKSESAAAGLAGELATVVGKADQALSREVVQAEIGSGKAVDDMVSEAGANAKRLGATEAEGEKSAQHVAARVADEKAAVERNRTDVAQWKNADGTNKYPPTGGFSGELTQITLNPGTRIDRYGLEQGRYLSPEGTPFAQRSLPETTNLTQYRVYEVVKPLEVQSGEIAPWFGYLGGGTQYFTGGKRIVDLIPEFLREVIP